MTRHAAQRCACTHPEEAHRHFRAGVECGLCECPAFRPHFGDAFIALFKRLFARLRRTL